MYYNGDKILNNPQPFSFLIGVRGTGKSYYYKRHVLRRYDKTKDKEAPEQFIYCRRYVSDLDKSIPTLLDDILHEFPDHDIKIDKRTIYFDDEICGFCIAVSEFIKYKSTPFPNVKWILFDEFLPEDGKYLGGKQNPFLEPELCLNFYQSVARGYKKPIRDDVMFIFIANSVTINNPYFQYFDIDKKINSNTKFYKGKGYNVELNKNESIVSEISDSKFGDLIKGSKYESYALGNDFYLDSDDFVKKITGNKNYLMTFKFDKLVFGLWRTSTGFYYLTDKIEPNCKNIYTLNSKDHNEESVLISRLNNTFIKDLIKAYAMSKVYFENQRCKSFFENAINK